MSYRASSVTLLSFSCHTLVDVADVTLLSLAILSGSSLSQPRPQLPGAHHPSDVSAASLLGRHRRCPLGHGPTRCRAGAKPSALHADGAHASRRSSGLRARLRLRRAPAAVAVVISEMQAARTSESAPPGPIPPAPAATGSAGSAGMGPPPGDSTWSFGNGVEDVD